MTPEIELLVRFSIALLIFSQVLYGQTHPNGTIDSLLRKGIEKIILQDYHSAEEIFLLLDKSFPDNPLANIYLAANEITKSVDYAEELNEDLVDSLLDLSMNKTEELLSADDENIWNNYYEALIHGYKAYYHSITGNLISAFADGILSMRSFQNCLEIDVDFYEAYIAIGTYNYWKSAQSKSFLWLPFVSDNRDEGISFLEESLNSFSYNQHLAAFSLIWIYIDYGKSDKAVALAERMLNEYEDSRFFKWGLARAYQDIDKRKAISVFMELLSSIETLPTNNQFNKIVLLHKIAMLYYEIDENEKSLSLCNEILDFNLYSAKIREKLNDRIERTKQLKEIILSEEEDYK